MSLDTSSQSSNAGPEPRPASRRILVVEDHEDYQKIICLALSRRFPGCEFIGAGDLQEAQRLAENQPVDVVLTDLTLTDGSGFDLMERLQKAERVPQFVVFSNYQREDLAAGLEKHHIRHFVHKGDGLSAMAKAVEAALGEV